MTVNIPKKGKQIDATYGSAITYENVVAMLSDHSHKDCHLRADEMSIQTFSAIPQFKNFFDKNTKREDIKRGHLGTMFGFPLIADPFVNGFTIHTNAT